MSQLSIIYSYTVHLTGFLGKSVSKLSAGFAGFYDMDLTVLYCHNM